MDTYLMKKAMIEAAVTRGIREMEEDPERSIRRLADLGRQFSKNRFQDQVFSIIQELLDNENSAYYDMMHNLLKNSDHEALRKFGVNFGYMSWAYGAATIRELEKKEGFCIPWSIRLRYDASENNNPAAFNTEKLASLIDQGQKLGIYVYFIRQSGNDTDSYALLELLGRYNDCAFVWFKEDGRLTAAQIQMLKVCKNTVVSLPAGVHEALLTSEILRDQKVIFAMHMLYDDNISDDQFRNVMEHVLTSETALFFSISKDGTKNVARQYCYDSRLRQEYPCVEMDYYGDGESISGVLTEHPCLLELDEFGRVVRPDGSKGTAFAFDLPLSEALRQVMPPFEG